MNELLTIMFSGFWSFVGWLVVIALILQFVLLMYNRTFRHWNIRKHGYPPSHCDADGDFRKEETDD
ncbi:hypothetical protein LCGC14_1584260 [marine sediment metagenome]|uniref:Uncharacterized protein n=1 Tax=marine sediment metagenome TaxID=412755 RepID=A0A0F9KWI6_9ZZZZ